MNAREELFMHLTPAFGPAEFSNALLDAYRDEVLREAAERIRNSDRLRDYTDDHMSDCNEAADEIDPDSYVNRCHGCGNPADDGRTHGYGAEYGGCV